MYYVLKPNSYWVVNSLRLGYTDQAVNAVWGRIRCLFWDKAERLSMLCGQTVEVCNFRLGVT